VTGMNTAEHRFHAKALFDESDPAIEIAAAEQDVIQFFRHSIGRVGACQHSCHQRARSDTQKRSPRQHGWSLLLAGSTM
jgi:hypothetical protein